MFTGLIEELGKVEEVVVLDVGATLRIQCKNVSSDIAIGASICVNGCCLTVVQVDGDILSFEAGTETLARTNLGELRKDSQVNLERSLMPSDRMGGHFVSGHIDATGVVSQRTDEGEWSEFHFAVPPELTRQMASKGSVAVDGISLTLVDVNDHEFSVALIPHTLSVTTLGERRVGETVNVETDILAKYVERQIMNRQPYPQNSQRT